jgi:hypothetical protein
MSSPLSEHELACTVEFTEAAAYADQARAAPSAFGMDAIVTAAGTAVYARAIDLLPFNRVMGCGLAQPAVAADVAAWVDRYRAIGVRNYGVAVSPLAAPADFASALGGIGLVARDAWPKMHRGATPAGPRPAPTLRVEPVATTHAERFGEVVCAGFDLPAGMVSFAAALVGRDRWHTYLAWDGETPVAGAALFVDGSAGWLGIASTLAAARRRGAQSALFARRLEDGARLGCRQFVTETGPERPDRPNPSLHNMVRAGFTLVYERPNFMPASETR